VVANHLVRDRRAIQFEHIQLFINDVQEEYHLDNLPIEFGNLDPPKESEIHEKDRLFIEQLKLIAVSHPRVRKAITDYFRAFNQRTKWVEDGNLDLTQLSCYDDRLKDEWERLFLEVLEELGDSNADEENVGAGRKIYNELQRRTDLNIRDRCTEAYVMRGSFHLLSNQLQIGWHPQFRELLKGSFTKALEGISARMD
jgi:hypothetical protein